jgi:archaellum biogenesis protein FlaJ (TadC family)
MKEYVVWEIQKWDGGRQTIDPRAPEPQRKQTNIHNNFVHALYLFRKLSEKEKNSDAVLKLISEYGKMWEQYNSVLGERIYLRDELNKKISECEFLLKYINELENE